jgi:hypothetical protein
VLLDGKDYKDIPPARIAPTRRHGDADGLPVLYVHLVLVMLISVHISVGIRGFDNI